MKVRIKKFLKNIVTSSYKKILNEKMTDDVEFFLKNIFYVSLGIFIANLLSFVFNILGGRILGPSKYGEFVLIQSIAMFLYLPMCLGFITALVKYNSEKIDDLRRQKIISTTCILILLFTVLSTIIYFTFSNQISGLFGISIEYLNLSVIFAILYTFYMVTINLFISLHDIKNYALFQPITSTILIITFLFFIMINFMSFESMLYSIYLSYVITGMIILILLRKYLKFEFDINWANKLLKYGWFAFIGGISFIIYTNIDKILISRFLTIADVGIYRAYGTASLTVVGAFLSIFIAVFFPTMSKYENKKIIFTRINKFLPYFILLGIPFLFCFMFIILKLYGSEYPIDLRLLVLFAIAGIMVFVNGCYVWLMNSIGRKGIQMTAYAGVICAVTNVILNYILIPSTGLVGAISTNIISLILFTLIVIARKNLLTAGVLKDIDYDVDIK